MRLVGADEVEDEICAAAGQLAHRGDGAGAIEHLPRAELGREGAPPWVGLDRDGGARAELVQELQRDVADTADADHGGRRAGDGQVRQATHGVVRREPGIRMRRDGRRLDAVGQAQERALVDEDEVGEPAVDGQPRELVVHAVHVVAAAAGDAEPAAVRRVHEHRVAGGDRGDAVPDRLDPARVLVAEHARQPDADAFHQAFDRVQIRRADAGAADPHDDVARTRDLRHRPLDELERLVVGAHECRFHGALLGLEVGACSSVSTSSRR